jgi:hypothetical protein
MYQVITKNELKALRAKQKVANVQEPLKWFSEFTKVLDSFGDDRVALQMGFGSHLYAFTKNGEVVYEIVENSEGEKTATGEAIKGRYRGWSEEMKDNSSNPPGCAPAVAKVGNVTIPAGVCLVIGAASTAKTPFAHALAAECSDRYAIVRYGEPLSGYITDPEQLTMTLARALIAEPVIVLDSVKDVLAMAPGGAMTSGISRGSFPILSDLSVVACDRGSVVIVPFNPSNPSADVISAMMEAARSNVTSVVMGQNNGDSTLWTVFSRSGEGLQRVTSEMVGTFEEGSDIMSINVKRGTAEHKTGASHPSQFIDMRNPVFENLLSSLFKTE